MRVSLKKARGALARLGERGRTTAVPGEVRAILVAYAVEQRDRGRAWATIAKEIGVSSTALIRWSQRGVRVCGGAVRVEVRPEKAREGTTVVLVSPGGYRIEGLERSEALAALRELG